LKAIATRIHQHTVTLAEALSAAGFTLGTEPYFDTLRVTRRRSPSQAILDRAPLTTSTCGY
jgi:glycine cleavage system pyridoxal-binding protein P